MAGIARLYERAFSAKPDRQVRKPRVDSRNRAFREIAELAASELTASAATTSDTQLVSADENTANSDSGATFHAALAALQAAAEHRDDSAVRRKYSRVMAAHSKLTASQAQ